MSYDHNTLSIIQIVKILKFCADWNKNDLYLFNISAVNKESQLTLERAGRIFSPEDLVENGTRQAKSDSFSSAMCI